MVTRASSTCRARSGFTLLEAVITLLLVSVVFGVAADLLSNACRVMSFSRAKSNSTQAIQVALTRMMAEAREAFAIDSTGPELVLLKVDPSANRFPTTPPLTWDPYLNQLRVRYYTSAGQLWRDVTGSTSSSQMVAEGIYGLSSSTVAGGGLQISLALLEDRVVRSLTTVVRTPAVVPP